MADLVLDRWQRQATHPNGPAPAMPDALPRVRPRSGEPPSRVESAPPWRALGFVATVAMVLGFAQGASVAVGSVSPPTPSPAVVAPARAATAPERAAAIATNPRFWRPAGSIATPPQARLAPRIWIPAGAVPPSDQAPATGLMAGPNEPEPGIASGR